jgi:hypothetical protein
VRYQAAPHPENKVEKITKPIINELRKSKLLFREKSKAFILMMKNFIVVADMKNG